MVKLGRVEPAVASPEAPGAATGPRDAVDPGEAAEPGVATDIGENFLPRPFTALPL